MGQMTGFGVINLLPGMVEEGGWATLNTAITLPIGLETYAAYSSHVFLNTTEPGPLRKFAGWSALCSLLLGGGGQVAYHIMESHEITRAPIWITAIVGSLPVAVLGMGTTLAAMVKRAEAGMERAERRRTVAERVAEVRSSMAAVAEAVKVPAVKVPAGTDIGATPVPVVSEVPYGPDPAPEVPAVPADPTPKDPARKVPSQRRSRGQWDMEKAVQAVLEGELSDQEVAAAVGTGPKNIQRTRRAVVEIRRNPHAEIPKDWRVPAAVVAIVRREVPKW